MRAWPRRTVPHCRNSRDLKILLVSVFRESVIGGVSVHSSNLRDRLRADGHDVHAVDFYGALAPGRGVLAKAASLIGACARVLSARLSGYRVVHFHTSNKAPLFYLTSLPLKLSGATLLLSVHSGLGYEPWLASHPLFAGLNRLFFPLLTRLIFMNEEEVARIGRRYPSIASRIAKVNPYIAPSVGEELSRPAPATLPLRVVTVGAFIPRYATEETLRACRRLTEEHGVPVHLTIVESSAYAQDAYRQKLTAEIDAARSPALTIDLVVDTQDILGTMAGHHAFVRPARGDSYGLCVAEALLLGIPSIATDVCTRCAAADLYAPGDLDALVAWLLERSRDLRTAGRSLLAPDEDSYHGYLDIYEAVQPA